MIFLLISTLFNQEKLVLVLMIQLKKILYWVVNSHLGKMLLGPIQKDREQQ
jgi:hypothetical protein